MKILMHLRNRKTAKRILIVLACIIIPAFVFWGAGSMMRSRDKTSFAGTINGRNISLLEYRDSYNAVLNIAIMQFGESLNDIKQQLRLETQAWERLVLLAEAQRRRITAPDREVIDTIRNYPFLQKEGSFNQRQYDELLRYVFHTQARTFEEQVRQNIILTKLYDQATSGITVSDEEVRKEYQRQNEEVSLYYIAGIPKEFSSNVTVSPEDVEAYYTANSLSFKQPRSFNIEYLSISSKDKKEEEIKALLKKIAARVGKKEDFRLVAKDEGLEVKESGFFTENDPLPGIGWAPQAITLLQKIKPGEFLPVLRMDEEYLLTKLIDTREARVPAFDEIKSQVKEALIQEKSRELTKAALAEARTQLSALNRPPEQADFDAVAKERGLQAKVTGFFKYGSYIEGIGASDLFWDKARDLKANEVSEILETPSGFSLIALKEKKPLDEAAFNAAKKEFSAGVLRSKKAALFQQFAQELIKKAKASF